MLLLDLVTPCVGVWIEILKEAKILAAHYVTPCVGVWIEIAAKSLELGRIFVTH